MFLRNEIDLLSPKLAIIICELAESTIEAKNVLTLDFTHHNWLNLFMSVEEPRSGFRIYFWVLRISREFSHSYILGALEILLAHKHLCKSGPCATILVHANIYTVWRSSRVMATRRLTTSTESSARTLASLAANRYPPNVSSLEQTVSDFESRKT